MKNESTFYINTYAIFEKVPHDLYFKLINKPSYISEDKRYKGKVSSEYWYTKDGVIRKSKHWGQVGNCQWDIEIGKNNYEEPIYMFCKWSEFKDIVILRHPMNNDDFDKEFDVYEYDIEYTFVEFGNIFNSKMRKRTSEYNGNLEIYKVSYGKDYWLDSEIESCPNHFATSIIAIILN